MASSGAGTGDEGRGGRDADGPTDGGAAGGGIRAPRRRLLCDGTRTLRPGRSPRSARAAARPAAQCDDDAAARRDQGGRGARERDGSVAGAGLGEVGATARG
ncbi:hypothetical protein SAMN05216489_05632 [Streptomyces sp. 3213]|nr:hypothetical protein SAMN05216489_05632 [Streptomyces sp. 3213] [Streptomyces sp. 3213.3]